MNSVMGAVLDRLEPRTRLLAVATLVAQIVIVGTGGAVRLTASGLGCPTWPRCTADSFVTTPEMGIHGVIEFANRLLFFVIAAIAVATFLSVVRMRRERPDLVRLSFAIGLGIPMQGVIGGISVLTRLDPWVVGLHYVLSIVLVVLATVYLDRVVNGRAAAGWAVRGAAGVLSCVTAVLGAITIAMGVTTTGSGPHSGGGGARRNGLDSDILQHVHSWPAYALVGVTVLLLVVAIRHEPDLIRATLLLLSVEAAQVLVGVTQARLGLPELLVGIHIVLASCLAAAIAHLVLRMQRVRATGGSATGSSAERAEPVRTG